MINIFALAHYGRLTGHGDATPFGRALTFALGLIILIFACTFGTRTGARVKGRNETILFRAVLVLIAFVFFFFGLGIFGK